MLRNSLSETGTAILPVGARQPDFTDDELIRTTRARLADLRPTG